MSNFPAYTTKTFSPTQKFFVLDPNTGNPAFVMGSDLVALAKNFVYSESTREAAVATDYPVGAFIQTAGATSVGGNFGATYLVVPAGEGNFPMDNGNELLVIKGDEFLREELVQPVATYNSVSQMVADPQLTVSRKARTLGYYTPGDGGGNDYEIVAAGAGVPDGGSFIDLDNGLQAKGLFISPFASITAKPEQFGAKHDGVYDGYVEIGAALKFADALYLGGYSNIFRVSSAPIIPSNTQVFGSGGWIYQPNHDATATISTGVEYSGFKIENGSENIAIRNIGVRGPFYNTATSPAYRSIGINISGRYDQYFYENANYPASPSVTPSSTSKNITIENCTISGFGQSGCIADQIDNFLFRGNRVNNCTRDGLRIYGCKNFTVSENFINDMSDGFPGEGIAPNNNVYGISATRVYHSTNGDGATDDYRPSSSGLVTGNHVTNCANWKALDTHGGTDITFSFNTIENAHIGIGIDKGGFNLSDGYAPPRRIRIAHNIIKAGPENTELHRAGITIFAHDISPENQGQDISVSGNYISGFGLDSKDGGIVISNINRISITSNDIAYCLGRAIVLNEDVQNCSIYGGVISNIRETTGGANYGINVSSALAYTSIDGVTFRQSTSVGTPMTAIATVSALSSYQPKVGDMNSYIGAVTNDLAIGHYRDDSPYITKTLAYANVNNTGSSATFVFDKGFVGATRVSTGIIELEVSTERGSLVPDVTAKGSGDYFYAVASGNTITVYCRDSGGALKDSGFYISVRGF